MRDVAGISLASVPTNSKGTGENAMNGMVTLMIFSTFLLGVWIGAIGSRCECHVDPVCEWAQARETVVKQ